jgi:hypothetical protein
MHVSHSLSHVPLITAHISSLPLRAHFFDVNLTLSPVTLWRHAAPKQRQVQLCYAFNWSMNNPQTHHPSIFEVIPESTISLFTKAPIRAWIFVYKGQMSLVDLENMTGYLLKITGLWNVMSFFYPEDGGSISLRMIEQNFYKNVYSHHCENIYVYVYYSYNYHHSDAWGLHDNEVLPLPQRLRQQVLSQRW